MRILITGGAGFIGSTYVRMVQAGLLAGVSNIKIVDNLTYAGNRKNLQKSNYEFFEFDIRDTDKMLKIASDCDAVINFAAESHVDRSILDPGSFFETNLMGTISILNVVQKLDIRFLQVSTDEVYGSIPIGASREIDPMLPNSPYAASKASADLACRSFFKTFGLNVTITRACNNYGPNQYPEKIIPFFVMRLLQSKKIPLYGNGTNMREWIHVDDHCRALHKVLFSGKPGEIYNVTGAIGLSNLDLSHKILAHFGLSDSSIEFVADRAGHDIRYSLDGSKIERELGFRTEIDFEEGLSSTIEWYRNNQEFWKSN